MERATSARTAAVRAAAVEAVTGKRRRRHERTPNRNRISRKTRVEPTEGAGIPAHRDVSPAGQDGDAATRHAGGGGAVPDRFVRKDRRGFPAARSARGAGGYPAAGFGEHSRPVAERRRDAGTRVGGDLRQVD